MMTSQEVRIFLEGRDVYAFDPETRKAVACITYGTDGRCLCRFVSGETDAGVYGFKDDSYWTRYETFRDGKTHVFRLEPQGPGVAQAWFEDGTKAFIQAHDAEIPDA